MFLSLFMWICMLAWEDAPYNTAIQWQKEATLWNEFLSTCNWRISAFSHEIFYFPGMKFWVHIFWFVKSLFYANLASYFLLSEYIIPRSIKKSIQNGFLLPLDGRIVLWRPVLISTFPCPYVPSVPCSMYKVYGTFIFLPGLDLATSGLEPNTGLRFDILSHIAIVNADSSQD